MNLPAHQSSAPKRKLRHPLFQSYLVKVAVLWSLLPMLLLSVYFLHRIYDSTLESAREQLSLTAQKSALEIEQSLLNLLHDFDSLSQQVPVIRAASGSFLGHRAVEQIEQFIERYPMVNAAFVLDRDLFAMETVPEEGITIDLAELPELHPLVRPLSIVDTLRQSVFLADHVGLAQLNRVPVVGVVDEEGANKVLVITSAIVASEGTGTRSIQLNGLLVATIPLAAVREAITSLPEIVQQDMSVAFLLGDQVLSRHSNLGEGDLVTETAAIEFTGLITDQPLRLELAQPMSIQLAIVYDAFRTSLFIIIALVIITVITSVLLSRRVVSPVRFLNRLTHQLAQGNYEPVSNTMRFREFRETVDLMNTMSGKISQQFDELLTIKSNLETTVSERTRELEDNLALLDKLNQRLEKMAATDSLTQMANRHAFEQALAAEVNRCKADGRYHFGIMVLDINGLKPINDNHGHEAGDQLIVAVARHLSKICRDEDLVARVGGDEFYILLRSAGEASARALERRLVATESALSLTLETDSGSFSHPITYSLGFATTEHTPIDELITRADQAMYARKSAYYDKA
ncbi:diguanylate cyclase domain-containing protein [Marinimicrobium sp. ABcell2]|uniref:diguanylate cyclase domain-containing protein n=1 Tax=Marinimicrobium sp. ABcell2 TaxID=3069751 RepID=UPI0027B2628E|nr:diguanylate cyclase [Marinimicrobium sp. ABcell2]MDQ2076347.1 diguanylate cyclase [Marinimicrobium sp. ABcell2]